MMMSGFPNNMPSSSSSSSSIQMNEVDEGACVRVKLEHPPSRWNTAVASNQAAKQATTTIFSVRRVFDAGAGAGGAVEEQLCVVGEEPKFDTGGDGAGEEKGEEEALMTAHGLDHLLLPEYTSLEGSWILDVSRSDTMEQFLRCLLMPETAIEAQVAGEQAHEVRHVIAVDESRLVVHKQAVVGDFTDIYEFGKVKTTKTTCGSMQCTASLQKRKQLGGVVISTSTQTADGEMHLVETRKIMGGGHVQAQVLHLGNSTTGVQCLTRRTWVRVPMTESDWQEVL